MQAIEMLRRLEDFKDTFRSACEHSRASYQKQGEFYREKSVTSLQFIACSDPLMEEPGGLDYFMTLWRRMNV